MQSSPRGKSGTHSSVHTICIQRHFIVIEKIRESHTNQNPSCRLTMRRRITMQSQTYLLLGMQVGKYVGVGILSSSSVF